MSERVTFPIPENEIYKLVKKGLHKMFRGNPSKEQFDDLVQDTMVRILEVIHHYDSTKGSFSNFIYMQVRWAIWRDMVHYSAKSRMRDYEINSLDSIIPRSEESDTLLQFIVDNAEVENLNNELFLNDILKRFNKEDQIIIKECIIKGKNLNKVIETFNLNKKGRTRKIQKLKEQLKEVLNENYI